MDHSYIDEHNLVARYGMGKLSPEECTLFEEHFVDCSRCQEQLEAAQDFNDVFKTVAAEDRLSPQLGITRALSFRTAAFWKPALIAAAACVVIFAVPSFFLMRQTRLAQAELHQANDAAENWHRQYVAQQQASAELGRQLHEAEPKGAQKHDVSGVPAAEPMAAVIFPLESVRGGGLNDDVPVNQTVIPRSAQSVVLSVNREDLEDMRSYRATLADSRGHILAQLNNLEASAGISVPASLLRPGDYRLILEGRSRQGAGSISRIYPFRVKAK